MSLGPLTHVGDPKEIPGLCLSDKNKYKFKRGGDIFGRDGPLPAHIWRKHVAIA